MFKKHLILLSIGISIILLLIAIAVYPGGSVFNKNATGFNWSENFISNLFPAYAINGTPNSSRLWADGGMIFLAISFAIFFFEFSKKIPTKSAAAIVKYSGAASMFFTFLIVTPLHDLMVTVASTLFLICLFYITVFVVKSRLHLWIKLLCVSCMAVIYYSLFLFGSGNWKWLPLMQKITLLNCVLVVVTLQYKTKKEDFQLIKKGL